MDEQIFNKLIKKDKYQVFLFGSKCTIPILFANHPWFVVSKKGRISRWEVLMIPEGCKSSWNHLHLNFLPPTTGINIIPYNLNYRWQSKLLGMIEGTKSSLVKKVIDVIENSPTNYPFNKKYSLFSPNSNSYVQWVLNQFPETNLNLPWNSFGKQYENL